MFPHWEKFVSVDRELSFEVTGNDRKIKRYCEPKCQCLKKGVIVHMVSVYVHHAFLVQGGGFIMGARKPFYWGFPWKLAEFSSQAFHFTF